LNYFNFITWAPIYILFKSLMTALVDLYIYTLYFNISILFFFKKNNSTCKKNTDTESSLSYIWYHKTRLSLIPRFGMWEEGVCNYPLISHQPYPPNVLNYPFKLNNRPDNRNFVVWSHSWSSTCHDYPPVSCPKPTLNPAKDPNPQLNTIDHLS